MTGDGARQETSAETAGNPGRPERDGPVSTVGIDIGGRTHVVARCRNGESRSDHEVLRVDRTLPPLARTAPIVTVAEAIDPAEAAAGGGNVVGLQLERELRRTIWEAAVAGTSRRGVEVWVDAATGGLLGPASSSAVNGNRVGCNACR